MFHIDFICACLLLIIVLVFNAYYRIYQVDKHGDKKGSANIYDLGFEIIPEISFKDPYREGLFKLFRDFVAGTPLLYALLVLDWSKRTYLISDIAILFMIRMIANNLTILPSIRACINTLNKWSFGGCCDLMFSGHTMTCLIGSLYIIYYINNSYVTTILFWNLFNQYLIIASRKHYSDDVYLAWFVTLCIFFIRTNDPRKVLKILFSGLEKIF